MIKAVIFDLDGTLADTLPAYFAAYHKVLREELNIDPDNEIIREKFGKRATEIMVGILTEMHIDPKKVDIERLIGRIRDEFVLRIESVRLLPGALNLLKELKGKYPVALGTSSRNYATNIILDMFGIRQYFDAVVTGEDVTHSKPHPEMFLLAAKRLGMKPSECVVLEDAVYGVEAAKAGGISVVAVTTGASTREELEKAKPTAIISTLKEFDIDILK